MKYVAETKNSDVQQQSSFQNVKLGCRGAEDSHLPPELSNLIIQVLAIERIRPLRRGDFAGGDQLTQLDRGRCNAPAPYYSYKNGKLVCRGAGDSHLPRSMRARSPHGLSPRRRFHRSRTRNEVPRADGHSASHRKFRRSSRT